MKRLSYRSYRAAALVMALAIIAMVSMQVLYTKGIIGAKEDREVFPPAYGELSREGYTLTRTVILSRHNIRSPLSGSGSAVGSLTPHKWFEWSSDAGELSLRGAALETEMGSFFRKWLECEGLFPENYMPGDGEVRIYSNSKQRTIATAKYFAAGLLPVADTVIEHHGGYDTMDPVFNPVFTFMSDEYAADITKEIFGLYGDELEGLREYYELLERVLDISDSEAFKTGSFPGFSTDDTEFSFTLGSEPAVSGSLKTGCQAADALVLQLYEEPDLSAAAFGEDLSFADWQKISYIKDLYGEVLFASPSVSVNVGYPLVAELYSEMTAEGRKFSFLCGHDSNVTGVLSALGAADYALPGSVEMKTPIGCKLVFCRWENAYGEAFWSVDMVYETAEQLRGMPLLIPGAGPAVYPVILEGIMMNEEGMYPEEAFLQRFRNAMDRYYELMDLYMPDELPEAV